MERNVRRFSGRSARNRAVAAVSVALIATSGCSSATQGTDDTARSASQRNADPADPSTWTLPVEAYLPSDDENRQIARARSTVIGDCMKRLGVEWSPAAELPTVGPKTLTDWRYGIHDAQLAKKRGYKPDAAEQAAYDKAMKAGALDEGSDGGPTEQALTGSERTVNGKDVPEGGCGGEAQRKLGGDGTEFAQTAQEVGNDAFLRSKQQPEVVAAFRDWSSCMKERGYSYKEPLDASDDPRFASEEVTDLEIATAAADLACRERHKVAKIWFEAEAALQKKGIEERAEHLDHVKKLRDAQVKKAAAVLAGTD